MWWLCTPSCALDFVTPLLLLSHPMRTILQRTFPNLAGAFVDRSVHQPPLTNAVYMGMGEPLDNPGAVKRSLQLLTHPLTLAMAKSKVSVSTVGPSPAAIRRMKEMPCRLAWSVHAATDEVRRLLVPTTVHTMAELRYDKVYTGDRDGGTC